MTTFSAITFIVSFWLALSLPFHVYPFYLVKDFFNFRKDWLRMRDFFMLLIIGAGIAFLIAGSIFKDFYNVIAFQENNFDPKAISLAGTLWLLFILSYYYFVMRHNKVKKESIVENIKNKPIIEKLNESGNKINRNLLFGLVIFIITSIGEGFFQDLIYNPFLKPLLCKTIGILCE
jgi:hypothetical protein